METGTLGRTTAAAVFGTGVGLLAYASLWERNAFTLRRFDLPVLPKGSAPLTVLHLSDLHLLPRQRRKRAWIAALAELEPDLVVNTGDNISSSASIEPLAESLGPLLDRPGVFVMGSNDYYAPHLRNPALYLTRHHRRGLGRGEALPTEDLRGLFTGHGWRDLNNRRARMTVGGHDLEFVGVDDPHLDRDDLAAVTGSPTPGTTLTIGVAHAPYQRVLDGFVADGAGLLLAGHTHGGQLCVPLFGALVTNCDLDTGRAKGPSRWWAGAGHTPSAKAPTGAAWMHVCAGLGTSPFAPVRFACRPEAALLTLIPQD